MHWHGLHAGPPTSAGGGVANSTSQQQPHADSRHRGRAVPPPQPSAPPAGILPRGHQGAHHHHHHHQHRVGPKQTVCCTCSSFASCPPTFLLSLSLARSTSLIGYTLRLHGRSLVLVLYTNKPLQSFYGHCPAHLALYSSVLMFAERAKFTDFGHITPLPSTGAPCLDGRKPWPRGLLGSD